MPGLRDADTFRPMHDERPCLYFDFVDPGSLLIRRRLATLGVDCTFVGFEMRPPPEPLVEPTDPAWMAYWRSVAGALGEVGVEASAAGLVPWTRKAHELTLHAAAAGGREVASAMSDRLFEAYVEEGRDIGRIDVLVPLAVEVGLDGTEARAVLDVDRWRDRLEEVRHHARGRGVAGVPTLAMAGDRLEGVHSIETIRGFLAGD